MKVEEVPPEKEEAPSPPRPTSPAAPPVAASPVVAATPAAAPPAPAVKLTDIASVQDANRGLRDAAGILRRVATYQRGENSASPLPYRLIRFAAWIEINQLPVNDNNRTMIPPVPKHLATRLNSLMQNGQWLEVINFTEAQITDTPFWLDLNYSCVLSLSNLGPSHQGAEQAVCDELSNFLTRFPSIPNFQFSDGTSFAGSDTKNWIETTLLASNETTGSQTSGPEEGAPGRLAELKETAKKLTSEKKFKDAILVFQQELTGISNMRERFLYKLELARTCFNAGEPKAAIPVLEELDSEIRQFSLETWEPALAAGVLHLLWLSLKRLFTSPGETSP
ncbi:MAG: hypothetical protein GY852_04235, partial [bacterium]|nr:hypothetical protein [bacterium]